MDQLALPIEPVARTVGTENGLFGDPLRSPVRQSIPLDRISPHPELRGFGSRPQALAPPPARPTRSRRFNLLTPLMIEQQEAPPVSSLRLLGLTLLVIGAACAAVAAWYLWGTGILTAGEQARLASEFQERLASTDATALDIGDAAAGIAGGITVPVAWDDPGIQVSNSVRAQLEAIPDLDGIMAEDPPAAGEPLGRITIPKAEVEWIVAEGTTPEILRGGPGHIIGTAMPGQVGNAVISGHRTTNGAPFYNLDRLEVGDIIEVETLVGTHVYSVVDTRVVDPSETWVATQWDDGAWLTLTTCTPRFTSKQRLIVFATLIDGPNVDVIHARYGRPTILPEG